ncbi:hypothetical protein ACFE04_001116 [Oxalis oulophora]
MNFRWNNVVDEGSSEFSHFDFGTISTATDDFSDNKILGQGGFGTVYKGTLSNGQEIAVKRLSKNSEQGELEFKTEVKLMTKLRHRNLVRLIGFSFEKDERVLVYEFLPNSSLDRYIFRKAALLFRVLIRYIGQRNWRNTNGELVVVENLVTSAWRSWYEGNALNLIDPILRSGSEREILRCIHIALLCVQKNAADRPNMASVVLMLSTQSLPPSAPLKPGYFMQSSFQSQSQSEPVKESTNGVTISDLDPR